MAHRKLVNVTHARPILTPFFSSLYMAPEILRHEKYNAKADLWSVGAVFYEMVTGRPPFRANNHIELLQHIEMGNDVIKFPASSTVSPESRRLIRGLLKKNPTERMGFAEFFNDPVVATEILTDHRQLDQSQLNEQMYISDYLQLGSIKPKPPRPALLVKQNPPSPPPPASVQTSENSASETIFLPNKPLQETVLANPSSGYISPSPGASWLLSIKPADKQKTTKTFESRAMDSSYVVVEKRAVEINTLADDFAYAPQNQIEAAGHAKSSSSSSSASSSASSPNLAKRRTTFPNTDRRSSITHGSSPTNALTRALTMASERLFGHGVAPPSPPSLQRPFSPVPVSQERGLIKVLEDLATKAKVIGIFAEVKFSQLVPTGPGNDLAPESLVVVSQEAVVLYVKTLSLLSLAMNSASIWWKNNGRENASPRLVDTVQWIRDKFNESLERAEHAQSQIYRHASVANKLKVNAITSEKLIFDRAMEMSRNAAKSEAACEDLTGCQLSYSTAIWMLEALLATDPQGSRSGSGSGNEQPDALDEEDTTIVLQFVDSLSHRLAVVRKKIEAEKSGRSPQQQAVPARSP